MLLGFDVARHDEFFLKKVLLHRKGSNSVRKKEGTMEMIAPEHDAVSTMQRVVGADAGARPKSVA